MTEHWRSIVGYSDYEVSSLGRIRLRIDRPNPRWKHGRSTYPKGKIIAQRLRARRSGQAAYYLVYLWNGSRQVERRVNRLVCEAFHGAPPSATHHAAHHNYDSQDNAAANLHWATPQEIIAGMVSAGRISQGEAHTPSKLRANTVFAIRRLCAIGTSYQEVADTFGISKSTVGQISRGETWKPLLQAAIN